MLGTLAKELDILVPSDEIHCRRDDATKVYLADGMTRVSDTEGDIPTYLRTPSQPSLGGALGVAISRGIAESGGLVLHAAALEYNGLKALTLGQGGAGKSSLAAAALCAGGKIVSDDLVVALKRPDGVVRSPELHPMRRDMYILPDTASLLPDSIRSRLKPGTNRRAPKLRLSRDGETTAFTNVLEPNCILVLKHQDRPERSTIAALDQASTLAAIVAANPFLQGDFPSLRKKLRDTALQLVSTTPAFAVSTGSRLLFDAEGEIARLRNLILAALP